MDVGEALARHLLESHQQEYLRLIDTWRMLEGKAQALVAIAGIFLGGMFGFAKEIRGQECILCKIAIIVVIILLSISVERSVRALRVRVIETAPTAAMTKRMVDILLAVKDATERSARFVPFLFDRARGWESTLRDHADANEEKAAALSQAQGFLFYAIVVAALLVAWTTIEPATRPVASPAKTQVS